MEKIKSEGKCYYCNKFFSKFAISRHLNAHLANPETPKKKGKSYHLRIELNPRWGSALYFLNVLADGKITFGDLDIFLREIWLECCGHLSAFRNPQSERKGDWNIMDAYDLLDAGKVKEYEQIMENATGEIPKSRKLQNVLHKDLKINYEYDFGSSTELQLKVLSEYEFGANGIELLSRNEPLKIMCDVCGKKPATIICSVCIDEDEGHFCNDCAKKHKKTCNDFADYAAMPVVNSPRMGVCAYEGGIIDTRRDGPYKMPA